MKKMMFVMVAILALSVAPSQAQNSPQNFKGVQNPAALQIAMNGAPQNFTNPVQCAVAMSQVWSDEKRVEKFCLTVHKTDSSTIKKVNNEGADATKNNWPDIVVSPYGYGGGLGTVGGDASLGYAVANGFCPGGKNPNTGLCH